MARHLRALASLSPQQVQQSNINRYASSRISDGAGRTIAKELSLLRSALRYSGIQSNVYTPAAIKRIPTKTSPPPSPYDVREILFSARRDTRLAVLLAIFGGLRNSEVYRLKWAHVRDLSGVHDSEQPTLHIPGGIRKTGADNVVPIVGVLEKEIRAIMGANNNERSDLLIESSPSVVQAELKSITKEFLPKWTGLQPARRSLCLWAEDAGHSPDVIALVTGHSRTSMTSRYAGAYGRIDTKRRVLEDVERTLLYG